MEARRHSGASHQRGARNPSTLGLTRRRAGLCLLWFTVVFMDSGLGPFGPPRNDAVVPYKISKL
ncbi:hypothetical protein CHELA20_10893 [Hyphomicrobiales bacterium]|nr:hypothetical protein CHELA20_10893 [Hyphomicrobiales bacterium]CAH1694141.1 hypothetical protein CHELA41_51123 [Hyphomicrobiales bacterium]